MQATRVSGKVVGSLVLATVVACSANQVTGDFDFDPVAVLAFLGDSMGNRIDAGNPALVAFSMSSTPVTCAQVENNTVPAGQSQSLFMIAFNNDAGVVSGETYKLSPNILAQVGAFGGMVESLADGGSRNLATYRDGTVTFTKVQLTSLEGRFALTGTRVDDGGTTTLSGGFSTSSLCNGY